MVCVYESTDLEGAVEIMRAAYGSMRLTSIADRNGLRIARQPLPGVRLDRMTFGMSVEVRSEPLDVLCIGRVRHGAVAYEFGGTEQHHVKGDVFMGAPNGTDFVSRIDELDAEWTIFEPSLLAEVAGVEPSGARALRMLSPKPTSIASARLWSRTYSYLRDSLTSPIDSPLITAQAARLLAAVTLETFPNTAVTEPSRTDAHDAHPETVRRAIALIESDPSADLTSGAIARAAFVTPRALQLAFRRHLDTTPMAYLRQVRLDRARRDLIAADPAQDTVTDIAHRWGFLTPSRFAAGYRATFGESPVQTLRR